MISQNPGRARAGRFPTWPRLAGAVRKAPGRRVVVAGVLLAALGCQDSPTGLDRDGERFVQTDRLAYTLVVGGQPGAEGVTADIAFRIENRTASPWSLQTCPIPHVELQKLQPNESWRTVFVYWDPLSSFCETVELAPGASFEHTLLLRGGLSGQASLPAFDNADPGGVYRLRVESLRSGDGASTPLPELWRVSNRFELRVEQVPG